MKLHRFGSAAAVVLASGLVLTACGNDDPTATTEETSSEADNNAAETEAATSEEAAAALSGDIKAAGASSQESAMSAWIAGYQGVQADVTVAYDPIGSGGGRENLIAGAVDFAGSDAYLDEEEREAVKDVCGDDGAIHIPVYISPVAIPYNLEGVDTLNLRPEVLAQIFDQKITKWNDPAIVADNPDVELPDLDITVVNRADESGTTENFMEYLSAAAPEQWTYEADKAWPVAGGEAAPQTTGVIDVVTSTPGAIGYADASAVTGTAASIGVGEEFVEFSPEAAAKVVDASSPADTGIEGDLALDLARDTTESGAYPIVLVSYHIACTSYDDAERANLVKDFLHYVVSEDGQAAASEAAGSAPLSAELSAKADALIDTIQGG
ncbi:phosphate ABC transporter substrate-binding protein PstS [Ornithinimicrobium tianjinense]|uniref:Phosphate-binding protein n=1 Tax=Ornithinimicrobium tianjinense TaxID=1195761 RepID=A0A917BFT0_9MICO|nr:phosphate ABC transporter substrate-binding protein PstS [Ornithinimicrobium tianjinense]GGF36827.1 phosphate-binding protein PstS [Ornithinimicrobium tianjinense]